MNNSNQNNEFSPKQSYLHYWKRAVALAGPSLFTGRGLTLEQITHWRELTPNIGAMHKSAPSKSTNQAAFIACLAAFFNAEEGAKIAKKTGHQNMGSLINALQLKERGIISMLIMYKQEW